MLQAYTDYLLNFDEASRFNQRINIARTPLTNRSSGIKSQKNAVITAVNFYPQGENLLENSTNLVAFKATNKAGSGIKACGSVVDERGKTVVTFETDYKGMGLFFLTPGPNKKYYAKINGLQNFKHEFLPQKEGLKIQIVNHTSSEIIVNIAGNAEKFRSQSFYLANVHQGKVLFYHSFILEGFNQVMKFNSQILGQGANRFVLLDAALNPVSECFLFSKNTQLIPFEITSDKNKYNTREKVTIEIREPSDSAKFEKLNLSLSALHTDALENGKKSRNILSHLLIDSEFTHFYENSTDFFTNDEISSEAKLRLLMLTSGWGDNLWNLIPERKAALQFKQTAGLNIWGVAKNTLTEKPLENAEITMVIQKDAEIAFLNETTNSSGIFEFTGLLYNDSAKVNIQAKNEKGKMNTSIEVFQPFSEKDTVIRSLQTLLENTYSPEPLKNLKYKSRSNTTNRPLIIKRNLKKDDTPLRENESKIYENADFVLEVNNNVSFSNVIDFMVGKVPGLDISANQVRMRGTSSFGASGAPLFLLDGVPVNSPANFELPGNTDRSTLFWEPNILVENGKKMLSFYTSDQTGHYKIFVEGISESGKICIGQGEFVVKQTP